MLELPKRISSIKYKDGILQTDSNEIPLAEFTPEIMEQLGSYTSMVGFYVEDYPMTDQLLEPLSGLKNMVNLGVKGGLLTDKSFEVFAGMPKLKYLWLDGNMDITGGGLELLGESKINALGMSGTHLDNEGLGMAARLPKLTHIHVDSTRVTFEGIMAVVGNRKLKICAKTQFTEEQLEEFAAAQREAGKKKLTLDMDAVTAARDVLQRFFDAMTDWEKDAYIRGVTSPEIRQPLQEIFAEYVSEKPRMGYRPLGLSASANGTYSGHQIVDAEQVTKSKLYIYTKESGGSKSEFRFLMRLVEGVWKIDSAQVNWNGWQRWGL